MDLTSGFRIEQATEADVPLLVTLIRGLAEYERLLDTVSATEDRLRASLFGERPYAEAVIAYENDQSVGYAIYFFTYSSFIGLPGLYLEDLFVVPESRGSGVGRRLLRFRRQQNRRAGMQPDGVGSVELERAGHRFLQESRCGTHERVDGLPTIGKQARDTGGHLQGKLLVCGAGQKHHASHTSRYPSTLRRIDIPVVSCSVVGLLLNGP